MTVVLRAARCALAFVLVVPVTSAVACDREDARDVEQGIEEGAKEIKKGAEKVEKGLDKKIDTDGKDD